MRNNRSNVVTVLAIVTLACAATQGQDATIWGVDPLIKVTPMAEPPIGGQPLLVEGARGETASGQVIFRSGDKAQGISAQMADLNNGNRVIPAACVRLQWVRYIAVKHNTQGIPQDELVAKAPCSIPDPYWDAPTVDVPARSAQPLWIEFDIPRDAPPGEYTSTVSVSWNGGSASLPINLTVWDFELPAARHQQVTQWFAFPGEGYRITPDSPEYWELATKFAKAMVAHRQTCFNTHLGTIKTTYDSQSGYVCDFTRLDRWAKIFFDAGMERMELMWAGQPTAGVDNPACRIVPTDLVVEVKEATAALTPEQKLRGILQQLEKHVQDKGWQSKVMIHIADEPFMHCVPTYRKVAEIVHEAAPSLKVIEAVEATGFGDAIDVLVPKLSHINLWWPYFQNARHSGKEVWFYTCCHPLGRYPNRFLDQPLVKTRVLHWVCYLYDLDGYLHWGLNQSAGGVDPYSEEGISQGLPLGDRAVMYPGKDGPVGSLRWSAMRDGLQDYEYLYTLQGRLAALKARLGRAGDWLDPRQRPLELCRRVATSFYDHTRDASALLDTRRAIAGEIGALRQGPVFYVQTEPPEGTPIPDGPRWIIVRGVAEPGATVKVNGAPIPNLGADGVFAAACHLLSPTVTIEMMKDGKSQTLTRSFRFVD